MPPAVAAAVVNISPPPPTVWLFWNSETMRLRLVALSCAITGKAPKSPATRNRMLAILWVFLNIFVLLCLDSVQLLFAGDYAWDSDPHPPHGPASFAIRRTTVLQRNTAEYRTETKTRLPTRVQHDHLRATRLSSHPATAWIFRKTHSFPLLTHESFTFDVGKSTSPKSFCQHETKRASGVLL